MMPEGGNRIEDEVPAVNWRRVFIAMVAVLLVWVGYAAVEATRKAGQFDTGGPQASAEGLPHFHGPQPNGNAREHRHSYMIRRLSSGDWAAERVLGLPTS